MEYRPVPLVQVDDMVGVSHMVATSLEIPQLEIHEL